MLLVLILMGVALLVIKYLDREDRLNQMQRELESRKSIQQSWDDLIKSIEESDDVPDQIRRKYLGRRLPDAPYEYLVKEFNKRHMLLRTEMAMLAQP